MNTKTSPLIGRTMYIPRMSFSGAKLAAAAFRSIGIDARPSPASDAKTLELGSKYLNGDECLPERITLGNFLKIIEDLSFNPIETAFLLPTAGGPCRFGQYQGILKKILKEKRLEQAMVVSPTSSDGYEGFGDSAREMIRTFWHSVLTSDIIRKMHLKFRPYSLDKDQANQIFHQSLEQLGNILATPKLKARQRLKKLRQALLTARDRYHRIPAKFTRDKPLIGIVGEIYCRLNEFSNEYLINKIEEFGGEVWMSDIAEWAWYTNDEQRLRLIRAGKRYSKDMFVAKIKFAIQHRDEHFLYKPLQQEFEGYEEPSHVQEILKYSRPYLPQEGALGEMVLNVGKSIYLHHKGADGIIDISPFTCMNGIVCETVYPQVSKDYDNFPIRIFYFDGAKIDLDRDVGIFLELAKNYMRKKKTPRVYPYYFN
jgi:predicted nucleotide-binding protein (sugar kinase/HSP70/actin superfamily)